MAHSPSLEVPTGTPVDAGERAPAERHGPDFPGCESFHLTASQVERYEGRLEFWDARTETAWKVSEPTSIHHEQPSRRLVQLSERIAALRGSRITCLGSSDLVRRDVAGRKRWLMQADEVLYLHPDRIRLRRSFIDVDADPLPDVVLEVDHSTDVRRRKLGIYMECGFPEVWVLVPWESSARNPGLSIHLREREGYRESPESRAISGWKATEIHHALTEDPLSLAGSEALARAALAMGAREGTTPQDDPFTCRVSTAERAANVLAVLRARSIEAKGSLEDYRHLIGGLSADALMTAAMACVDEDDFRRRVRTRDG